MNESLSKMKCGSEYGWKLSLKVKHLDTNSNYAIYWVSDV